MDATTNLYWPAPSHTFSLCLSAILLSSPFFPLTINITISCITDYEVCDNKRLRTYNQVVSFGDLLTIKCWLFSLFPFQAGSFGYTLGSSPIGSNGLLAASGSSLNNIKLEAPSGHLSANAGGGYYTWCQCHKTFLFVSYGEVSLSVALSSSTRLILFCLSLIVWSRVS
jgi:hypothetical protein